MNKKLKKMLVAVSAVAVCSVSIVPTCVGALYIPVDEKITPYTTAFTAMGKKYHLFQEANDYFSDTILGQHYRIYISDEPLYYSDEGKECYGLMGSIHQVWKEGPQEKWYDFCEAGILCISGFTFENEEDLSLVESYLSKYGVDVYNDFDEYDGCTFVTPLWTASGINEYEQFEILQTIKEETGFTVGCSMLLASSEVTDVENALPEPTLSGDANEDGKVSLADAVLIMQALSNPDEYKLTPQGMANADIVGDGDGVTAMDALRIQEIELGI